VRKWTEQGKTIARVRIIDDPPTDYQRWSLWASQWHRDAGEDIRYLRRKTAHNLGIGPGDWQLFDHRRLVLMAFTDTGEPASKTLITVPAVIARHRSWRAEAIAHARTADTIPV
jgi:hypothetical protein